MSGKERRRERTLSLTHSLCSHVLKLSLHSTSCCVVERDPLSFICIRNELSFGLGAIVSDLVFLPPSCIRVCTWIELKVTNAHYPEKETCQACDCGRLHVFFFWFSFLFSLVVQFTSDLYSPKIGVYLS